METTSDLPRRIDMTIRLERAGEHVRATKEAHDLALEQRNELIRQAVDLERMTTTAAARACGLAQSRIMAIIANAA